MSLNIQPGKFYKLRNGCKMECYSVGNAGLYSVHGRIFEDGQTSCDQWQSPGNYRLGEQSDYDIIAEWEEPAPKLVLWRLKADLHNGFDVVEEHCGTLRLLEEGCVIKNSNWERVDPKRILGVE